MATPNASNERQALEMKYKNARGNLLIVIAFTLVNIILLLIKSDSFFLFSAFFPYMLVSIGMVMCGIYPQEYFAEEIPFANTLSESAFPFFLFFALVILLLYFVCWVFSKNNKVGWLIFALVFFAIDTVILLLFLGIQADSILNIVFHGWVIVSLIMGIRASYKLKKLPIADAAGPETADAAETQEALSNSEVIRTADKNVKAKILLETNALDHSITYRRIKRVNELVIDGNVYDEFNALVEVAHSLNAKIDGHLIEAGYDGKFHSYVKVDGQMVAKKLRLI